MGREVLVLSYPQDLSGRLILSRFLRIFGAIGLTPKVVTNRAAAGDSTVSIRFPPGPGILGYILFQLNLGIILKRRITHSLPVWFLVGGNAMVFPIVIARLLREKPILVLVASPSGMEALRSGRSSLRTILLRIAENLSVRFSSYVIAYGRSVPHFQKIERLRSDFITCGAEFVDPEMFAPGPEVHDRPLAIAYVGRFAAEKGVENLWTALEETLRQHPSLEAFLAGGGPLEHELALKIHQSAVGQRVHMLGWLNHPELAKFYRQVRLVVIPSFTEALPNVMLEAMSSGTLVLSTRVGAVPDVIIDGYNGFLVDENRPPELSAAIERILSLPEAEISRITRQARETVEREYTFQRAVERYRRIARQLDLDS